MQAAIVGIVPRIDVLAQQRDLACARIHQRLGLVDDRREGAADLRPARIGHHAIGAEFVASLLHGQEGRGADLAAAGQMGEFRLDRHVRVERGLACYRLGDQLGQIVIGLRAHHHIDLGAADDLRAFGWATQPATAIMGLRPCSPASLRRRPISE